SAAAGTSSHGYPTTPPAAGWVTVGRVTGTAAPGALIDTHCHLDVAAFDADRDAVVARATAAGVAGILIPAIRPHTWGAVRTLAHRHAAAGVRFALGIHPQIVPELAPDELAGD